MAILLRFLIVQSINNLYINYFIVDVLKGQPFFFLNTKLETDLIKIVWFRLGHLLDVLNDVSFH